MHIRGNVFVKLVSCSTHMKPKTYYQTQSSATLCINQEQGRNCEDDLDGTIAKRCVQSLVVSVAGIGED